MKVCLRSSDCYLLPIQYPALYNDARSISSFGGKLFFFQFCSLLLILTPRVFPLIGYILSAGIRLTADVFSFLVPVLGAAISVIAWRRAKITTKRATKFAEFLGACIRENSFDEAERILRANKDCLHKNLPDDVLRRVFDRELVRTVIRSREWIHLDLLSNLDLLNGLTDRLSVTDIVVREMLSTETSPLRSAVVREYGGDETVFYPRPERNLIESTFQNPVWYVKANAHYPLVVMAVEQIQSGSLDGPYNEHGGWYTWNQGVSPRSRCLVYLALKTHVLAISAAIEQASKGDFYVTDIWDLFRSIRPRSKYRDDVWDLSKHDYPLPANPEYPTPFAFLLYEICSDLESLSSEGIRRGLRDMGASFPNGLQQILRSLAMSWSYCIHNIARSQTNVSDEFKRDRIRDFLCFVLKLGYGPSEILHAGQQVAPRALNEWRDVWMNELKARFVGIEPVARASLRGAVTALDLGKQYVFSGEAWLKSQVASIT